MGPEIRPGARVTVVSQRELLRLGCHHRHYLSGLVLEGAVSVVDRIDERYGDHSVIVTFLTIACPPFGTAWVDSFTASELIVV